MCINVETYPAWSIYLPSIKICKNLLMGLKVCRRSLWKVIAKLWNFVFTWSWLMCFGKLLRSLLAYKSSLDICINGMGAFSLQVSKQTSAVSEQKRVLKFKLAPCLQSLCILYLLRKSELWRLRIKKLLLNCNWVFL